MHLPRSMSLSSQFSTGPECNFDMILDLVFSKSLSLLAKHILQSEQDEQILLKVLSMISSVSVDEGAFIWLANFPITVESFVSESDTLSNS